MLFVCYVSSIHTREFKFSKIHR